MPARRVLVVGMLRGKDPSDMLRALEANKARLVIACPPPSPRAMPPEDVAAAAAGLGCPTEVTTSVADAVALARDVAGPDDLILVTGSLYVVGRPGGPSRRRSRRRPAGSAGRPWLRFSPERYGPRRRIDGDRGAGSPSPDDGVPVGTPHHLRWIRGVSPLDPPKVWARENRRRPPGHASRATRSSAAGGQ